MLAVLSGVLYFLGFAGFDHWPLALVAFVPFLAFVDLGLEPRAPAKPGKPDRPLRRVVLLAWLMGFVTHWGGYYWLLGMLRDFSSFPLPLCALFASVLCAYQGFSFGILGLLCALLQRRGVRPSIALVLSVATVELLYPLLFPSFLANAFHDVPVLTQIADLGGPITLSVVVAFFSGALYELLRARFFPGLCPPAAKKDARLPWRPLAASLGLLAATVGYGAWRIGVVDALSAASPALRVGLVQTNMGIFAKRAHPEEGLRRHVLQSLDLERDGVDLLVWPESAYTYLIPDYVRNVRRLVMGPLRTPLLFGGLALRRTAERRRHFNTAYITDAQGNLRGTYDKTYLLMFGEYLPFGETFPVLYDISPRSGRFTPGSSLRPLPFVFRGHTYRLTTLVCYEDVLPGFVRDAVDEADPHLLVNITNDAWFGKTKEPEIHLALSQFRAIEHHRWLVRATNSGVSAIVDPAGRVTERSGVFERASVRGTVRLMGAGRRTLFGILGSWPGYLSALATALVLAIGRWRARKRPAA